MRVTAIAAATVLAALLPHAALAQDAAPESDMSELADRLGDPAEQQRIAMMLDTLGELVLALPVGPLVEAMSEATGEELSPIEPDATVGDIAGPGAEDLPEELSERVPQMMDGMAGMVEGIEAMRPMLEAMARTMREQIERGGRY